MAKLNGTVNSVSMENGDADVPMLELGTHSYTLPKFRYVNIFGFFLLVDAIVSVILWLTGGDSHYFIHNITHFTMTSSVFDLALLSAVKLVILIGIVLPSLENSSYQLIEIDNTTHRQLKAKKIRLHVCLIILTIGLLSYTTTKGALVLHAYKDTDNYTVMHATYNTLVIFAFVCSLLEVLFALSSFTMMRRLKTVRILHRFNDDGEEIGKDGEPLKRSVTFSRLAALAKPELGLLGFASIGLLFSSASQMVAPLFFGKVVDAAQHSISELTRTVLIMLGIYLVGNLFGMIRAWLFTLAGMRLVARLRKRLFNSIIQQEVAFFDVNRTGELCNRLSSDTQVLQNAVTVNMSMLVRNVLQLIGSLGFMFYLNPALTGVLLSVVPIVSLGAVQYGKLVKKLRKKFQDKLADAGTMAEESLSSIRTVRTFSAEGKAGHMYGVEIDESYNVGKKLALVTGGFTGVIGTVAYGAITVVLWYGGKLVYDNQHGTPTGLTPGILTSFLLYTLQVALAFTFTTALYGDFMQAVGASIRIFDLLDRQPKVSNENGVVLGSIDGRVEFDNVKFTYPSRPETEVLKGISFTLEPGKVLALVGPSGGGKSTIVNLIERFYDPDSGTVSLGSNNLRELEPRWFRQKIAMVSQEPTLFACSIKENIAYGKTATDAEIQEAAKQANAHGFISEFEKGYETLVGERGIRLSGGQKQRIAIARALIMDPVLLLLDEATSALDAESEHLVQEAVERAMKGRTVIVIAHRLSTVRNATQVIVIDKGVVAESGTHDELISKDGVYKRLVLRQLMAGNASLNGPATEDDGNDNKKDTIFTIGDSDSHSTSLH
ncbi:ABC transporter B family member 25-like [Pecten maximus]|uniref:ABC transporter B family member 25-like n=1 Tax=Pecten maximus TaxID=6579 RepID=UPI001458739F|nr:ABC transporter B family member 25-like [Pecten maximus]XP_033747568.1 ABC transporter B family member 25-like [Pecten maximus]